MNGDFLKHYGVKGMRWGVRSANSTSGASTSEDARVATTAHAKAKSSGTHTLSNRELQAVITRMNLEQQYARLNPSSTTKAIGMVTQILGVGTTVNQAIAFVNSPAGKAIKDALKR
jgi:hypothetical protein